MGSKIRVLVVDDDPKWREDTQTNLRQWGYEPIIAEGYGRFLMENAIEKCVAYSCQIALIDMELFDRPGNHEGLKLAPKLRPASPIIVTGHHSDSAVREAYKVYEVSDFIKKEDGPNTLKKAIAETIKSEWKTIEERNRNTVEIKWPGNIQDIDLVHRFRANGVQNLRDDEITKALRMHFDKASVIRLESWEKVNTSETLDLNRSGRSIIFKANVLDRHGNLMRPTVIKIARKKRVVQEEHNFKEWIESYIPTRNFARVSKVTTTWHIGIIEYEYMAGLNVYNEEHPFPTFRKFFLDKNSKEIQETLERLFDWVWKAQFERRERSTLSLFRAYEKVWNSEQRPNYLLERLEHFRNHSMFDTTFEFQGVSLPNPVIWTLSQITETDNSPTTFRSTVTHGDLHSSNLLIGNNNQPILIDFERTGIGPIFQDLALLTIDILIHILNKISDAERLFIFMKVVWRNWEIPNEFSNLYRLELVQKGIECIQYIRIVATSIESPACHTNIEPNFLWGLLLNINFRATLLQNWLRNPSAANSVLKTELRRVMLLGALISLRLDNLRSNTPPLSILNAMTTTLNNFRFDDIPSNSINRVTLRLRMELHLGSIDLRTICFDLGLPVENFREEKAIFIIDILEHVERSNRTNELIGYLCQQFPSVRWRDNHYPANT